MLARKTHRQIHTQIWPPRSQHAGFKPVPKLEHLFHSLLRNLKTNGRNGALATGFYYSYFEKTSVKSVKASSTADFSQRAMSTPLFQLSHCEPLRARQLSAGVPSTSQIGIKLDANVCGMQKAAYHLFRLSIHLLRATV